VVIEILVERQEKSSGILLEKILFHRNSINSTG